MNINRRWFWILLICASCASPSSSSEESVPENWVSKLGFSADEDPYLEVLGQSSENLNKRFSDLKPSGKLEKAQIKISLAPVDSAYYNLELLWVNDEVSQVNLDVFPKDSAQSAAMFTDLKSYYSAKFGEGGEAADYAVWYEGNDMEISLLDESENYGKPYIAIIYLQEEGIAD